MPERRCGECGGVVVVLQDQWKLVSYPGVFVCSTGCILTWIRKHYSSTYELLEAIDLSAGEREYKSDFERVFAAWLYANHLDFRYECWGFEVGKTKTYTPDFFIPSHGCFVETKGRWGLGQKTKLWEWQEQYPAIPLLVAHWLIWAELRQVKVARPIGAVAR